LARVALGKAGAVPCTGCRYCMECPAGVDIPRLFAMYNQYKASGVKWYYQFEYDLVFGRKKGAEHCTRCGACLPKCPQQIKIPDFLDEVAQAADRKK